MVTSTADAFFKLQRILTMLSRRTSVDQDASLVYRAVRRSDQTAPPAGTGSGCSLAILDRQAY